MAKIHPLATVHPNAKLGENVEVGPYAYIEEHVEIGDGSRILPHSTIFNYVKMGKNCTVFPGAVIGAIPQDLKFDGEVTYVEIGDNVNIRECATINRGTKASGRGVTKIGNNVLLMSYTHVAHDCTVGNNCILVSYVGIAGETDVDDWATIGGSSVAHQFSRIGKHAFIGGGCKINKDVPPYVLCGRDPLSYAGVNIVGLRRRGFTATSRICTTSSTATATISLMLLQRLNQASLNRKKGIPSSSSSEDPSAVSSVVPARMRKAT